MVSALRSKSLLVPSVPFVEARFQGGKQQPSSIVFTSSVTSSEQGAAFKVANYQFNTTVPIKSYHYVVDEASAYRCVNDRVSVLHDDQDVKGAIIVGLCSPPFLSDDHWDDTRHVGVLNQAADVAAQLCIIHTIPVRALNAEREAKWRKLRMRFRGGLIFKVDGDFPLDQFLTHVQTKVAAHKSAFSRR